MILTDGAHYVFGVGIFGERRKAAQVEEYEGSGGIRGTTVGGLPVVLLTTMGVRSGKLRKSPVMRVEHEWT